MADEQLGQFDSAVCYARELLRAANKISASTEKVTNAIINNI
jgi:hypothetical protein